MSRTVRVRFAVFALLASTMLLSGQTCDEGSAGQCVPGRVVACPCPDGSDGLQECRDDNTYGACACGDAGSTAADAEDDSGATDIVEEDAEIDVVTQDAGEDAAQTDSAGGPLPYLYVKVADLSEAEPGADAPGADIDAIELVKSGESYWATSIEESSVGGGTDNQYPVVDSALGRADSVSTDGSTCSLDGFVSLGGLSGFLVVSFEQDVEIEAGDTLRVYEVGGCDFGGGTANGEPLEIQVGVYSDPSRNWSRVAYSDSSESPIITYTVEASHLPTVSGD